MKASALTTRFVEATFVRHGLIGTIKTLRATHVAVLLGLASSLMPAVPQPLVAQTALRYGANVAFATRYEWRGITRRNASVIQPELFVSYGRQHWIATGVWTNLALHGSSSSPRFLGTGRRALGENTLWGEGSVLLGPLRVSAGAARYVLRPSSDSVAAYSLASFTELYGRVTAWGLGRVVPEVALYQALGDVGGTYGEGAITLRVPLWTGVLAPVHSLLLAGRLGVSFSDDQDTGGWFFQETGVTHLDISLGTTIGDIGPIGPFTLYLHPEVHFQRGYDPNTRLADNARVDRTRWWVRLGIGLTGPTCRPDRQICP